MIDTFFTAYDPSDLPGSSIDPLGFERGYLFLADKILPGLTNVASRPRYFALICAGIHICRDIPEAPPRQIVSQRQETILRLERFWALANVLARPDESGGIRGVTYAKAQVQELEHDGATRVSAKYRLLSRQTQYGAIGMYANVADGMHFFNRDDFTLTPGLGEVAAEAFRDETQMPSSLRRAVLDNGEVSRSLLTAWGERAHVDAKIQSKEARCLLEALHSNPVRSNMAGLLARHPPESDDEAELARLDRIGKTLKTTGQHPDLAEAIDCILAFESCFRLASLALERLLWLCRNHAAGYLNLGDLAGDRVLRSVSDRLAVHVRRFLDSLNNGVQPGFRQDLDRLADVRRFLEEACAAVGDTQTFVGVLLSRHTDVQRGKFDRGRRKMPWLERNDCRLSLTPTRAGGLDFEATEPGEIDPHPYRLRAADALISASANAARL